MVHLGFEVDLTFILESLPEEVLEGEEGGVQMEVDYPDAQADWNKSQGGRGGKEKEAKMVKKGRTRVTTLFSATMPPPVERLSRKYLRKPAVITIGEAGRAVDTVEQRVEFVSGDEKKKCVVFCLCLYICLPRADITFTDKNSSRSSTQANSPPPLSCSSTRRRRRTWSRRTCSARMSVSFL